MGRADLGRHRRDCLRLSIFSAEPLDFFPRDDIEAFIDGLRWCHQFAYERKEANGLISPSIFDQSLSDDTSRGLANIRAIWGIWLDNDGGDLTHQEFARLFPRLRMVITNSLQQHAGEATVAGVHPDHDRHADRRLQGHRRADHANGEPRWVLVAEAA